MRRSGFVLFAFSALAALASTAALASPGCDALNGGDYVGTGFSAGDKLNVTLVQNGDLNASFAGFYDVTAGSVALVSLQTASWSYTVPADTSHQLFIAYGLNSGDQLSWTCISAPSKSQKLEQVRKTFSKLAAQTSSQAMGDAAGDAISDAFDGNGSTQAGSGRVSFSSASIGNAPERASKSDGQRAIDALAYNAPGQGLGANASFAKAAPLSASPWHVWVDARFTGLDDRDNRTKDFDGRHTNAMAGASYRFNPAFLAGLLVGYEDFRYRTDVDGTPTALRGNGVSGGAYFGWKFWDRLRLDGMVSYGKVSYTAESGTVSGGFDANRITAMTRISGRYGLGWGWFEPSSTITLASERQESFTDSASESHGRFNFLVGRSATGGTIGVPFVVPAGILTPSFGVFADYRFGDETVAAISSVPTFDNGWSARVKGGLNLAGSHGFTGSLGGEYGGLGQDLRYWRVDARLGAKF